MYFESFVGSNNTLVAMGHSDNGSAFRTKFIDIDDFVFPFKPTLSESVIQEFEQRLIWNNDSLRTSGGLEVSVENGTGFCGIYVKTVKSTFATSTLADHRGKANLVYSMNALNVGDTVVVICKNGDSKMVRTSIRRIRPLFHVETNQSMTEWREESKHLLGQIKDIDSRLNQMRRNSRQDILNSDSVSTLKKNFEDAKSHFNVTYQTWKEDQMEMCRRYKSSNDGQQSTQMSLICALSESNDTESLNADIADLDGQIMRHQQIIDGLEIEQREKVRTRERMEENLKEKERIHSDLQAEGEHVDRMTAAITDDVESFEATDFDSVARSALQRCERRTAEWSTDDLLEWLKFIEDGRFGEIGYQKAIEVLRGSEVNGSSISDLRNHALLRSAGLEPVDRECIFKNIDRVMKHKQKSGDQKEEDMNLCHNCAEITINTVFLPCGHQMYCQECKKEHGDKLKGICPVCRAQFTEIKKTIMNGFGNE